MLPDARVERAHDLQHRPARHLRPLAGEANPPSLHEQPHLHGGGDAAARHKQRISTCVDSYAVHECVRLCGAEQAQDHACGRLLHTPRCLGCVQEILISPDAPACRLPPRARTFCLSTVIFFKCPSPYETNWQSSSPCVSLLSLCLSRSWLNQSGGLKKASTRLGLRSVSVWERWDLLSLSLSVCRAPPRGAFRLLLGNPVCRLILYGIHLRDLVTPLKSSYLN